MRLLQQVLQPIGAAANQRQVGAQSTRNYCFARQSWVGLQQVLLPVAVGVKRRCLRREHHSERSFGFHRA